MVYIDIEERKRYIRGLIETAEAEMRQREYDVATKQKKRKGPLMSFLTFDMGLSTLTSSSGKSGLRRAGWKVDDLRRRYARLERAASAGNSFSEIMDLLHEQKQWVRSNSLSSEGGDLVVLLGKAVGMSDLVESAEEQILVLLSRARQSLQSYLSELAASDKSVIDLEASKFQREIDETSQDITALENRSSILIKPLAEALREYKRLLEEVTAQLQQMRTASPKIASPQEEARRVTDQVQRMSETVSLLQKQCEDDVRKYPDQAEAIERRYRKAIDAILEAS